MTFGTELQQPASHRALLQLQDAEIQLLELMKKCVQQRIKSDREYANSLMVIVNHAQKVDLGGTSTPLFQVWGNIVKETEGIISMLRDNAEQLSTKSMDRLVHVISEKKTARKFYNDERLRLDSEFSKLKDDVTRLRQEYERSVNKQIQERLKFEELRNRGVTGRKLEDAKGKLQKASLKLHKVNNDYVSTLLEAKLYQTNMLEITLPGILNYQQEIQQTLVEQCKSVLEEYATLTDLSAPEYSKHYQTINETIGTINPITEYVNFVKDSKSDPVQPLKIEFDDDLLVGYKGTLRNNTIALDNLTVEHVQHSQSRITDLLNECQQKLTNKSSSLGTQKKQLEKLPGESRLLEMQRNSICVHKRAVLDLEREIKELQGRESILKSLQSLYTDQLAKLGDKELPPGVDLGDDSTEPTPPRDQHSINKETPESPDSSVDETSNRPGGHFQNLTEKLTSVFGKNKKSTPPIVPAKDFHTEGTDSYIDAEPPRPPASNHVTPRWSESENHDTPGSNRITQSPSESYQPVSFDEEVQPLFQMNPNPTIKLDEEEWMHGVLPREEVQRLLTTNGDYLVRESKNRKTGETQYVLSVFWDDHKHFIIQGTEGNWRFEGDQYPSVQELIINQHNSGVPVTRKSGAILKRPIKRETWELRNDDLILGQKIGNGNFGDVFKGTYKPQKLEVAIKTCRETLSEDAKKKFLQEGRILKQYDHPNIVRFIGIGAQRHPVMIVMEYVSGGALLTFLKKQGSHQTKKQLVKMCDDAAAGMAYLEERSCIHRDLAARNCLVGKHNIVKISDFGMSREEEEYTVSGGLKQIPIKWTAPEALNFGTYTTACDVWSFGVLMWEVFSFGQSPYPGLTNTQARERVDEGYRMPSPEGTPSVVHDLMLRCWAYEAKDRPSFKDIHCDLQKIHKDLPVR